MTAQSDPQCGDSGSSARKRGPLGIIILILIVLAIGGGVGYCCWRRNKNKKLQAQGQNDVVVQGNVAMNVQRSNVVMPPGVQSNVVMPPGLQSNVVMPPTGPGTYVNSFMVQGIPASVAVATAPGPGTEMVMFENKHRASLVP